MAVAMALPMNKPITEAERRLMELAQALAAANPDAAAVLGRHLSQAATEQKRARWAPEGCGIVIRINRVEGKVEMIQGE